MPCNLEVVLDPSFSFDALIFHNRTFFAFCFGSGLKYNCVSRVRRLDSSLDDKHVRGVVMDQDQLLLTHQTVVTLKKKDFTSNKEAKLPLHS